MDAELIIWGFCSSGMDIFSTTLWHLRKEYELSYLAQELVEFDKFAPESWCAVGNCFSLQNEHETAIKFFHRVSSFLFFVLRQLHFLSKFACLSLSNLILIIFCLTSSNLILNIFFQSYSYYLFQILFLLSFVYFLQILFLFFQSYSLSSFFNYHFPFCS